MAYVIDDSQNRPNILVNGDMAIAQRAPLSGVAVTTGGIYVADRWLGWSTASGNASIFQQTLTGLTGFGNNIRVQRTGANTSTAPLSVAQNVETQVARRYQGRTLTLSFWARAGANFSSASSLLNVAFVSGTGTDESVRAGFTGSTSPISTTVTLTTTFQQFVFTVTIPATSTEFAPTFSYTPVGTAGANDYFDLTGVMLTEGGLQPYRGAGATAEDERAICQRYYEKSTSYANAPGTAGIGYICNVRYNNVQGFCYGPYTSFRVSKRASPTLTFYGYNATNPQSVGQLYCYAGLGSQGAPNTGTTGLQNAAASMLTENGFSVYVANAFFDYTAILGDWTADADIY